MSNVIHRTTLKQRYSVHTPYYSIAIWIINPDLSAVSGVLKKYWKIVGDSVEEMTQGEKDTVDAALLPGTKVNKIRLLKIDAERYIESRYPNERITLDTALDSSIQRKLNTRRDYLNPWRTWVVDEVYGLVKIKEDEVTSSSTLIEVDAVNWDFTQFDSTDPEVSIAGALAETAIFLTTRQLWVPAKEMVADEKKPAEFGSGTVSGATIEYFIFVKNKIKGVFFKKVLGGWIPEQPIYFTFYWLADGGSGSVTWEAAASANPKGPFNQERCVSDVFSTPDKINISSKTLDIEVTKQPQEGDNISFNIERNGKQDTLNGSAKLTGVLIEYTLPQPNV